MKMKVKLETETPRVFVHPDGRVDRKNAALFIGCSPTTLADWAMKGSGPKYAILGGRAFYFLDDIEEWVAKARRLSGVGGRGDRS